MFLNFRPSASSPEASTGGPSRYSQISRPRNFPRGADVSLLRAIALAPAADHVEVLQGEAGRIDPGMARGAARQRPMLGELLANRGRAARIGLERRDIGGRGIGRFAEQPPHDPGAAQHRRGDGAVGRHLEHARLGQHAAAMTARRQRHAAELFPGHAGDLVMFGDAAVEHQKVGMDEVAQLRIVAEQFGEERVRFADHGRFEDVVEFRVELPVGLGEVDLPQLEPLADEVLDERPRPWGGQHPLDLAVQDRGLVQGPARPRASAARRPAACSRESRTAGTPAPSRRAARGARRGTGTSAT